MSRTRDLQQRRDVTRLIVVISSPRGSRNMGRSVAIGSGWTRLRGMENDLQASCDAVLGALRSSGGMADADGWRHIYSTVSEADEAVVHLIDQGTLFYDGNGMLRMKRPGLVDRKSTRL